MPGHVTKRGSRWRARYPDPLRGGTAQIERVFSTKTEAQDWLLDMQHSAKTGTFIDPAASARRFADVVDEWRGTWADLEPKTKAGYASILNKHLLPRYVAAYCGLRAGELWALRRCDVDLLHNELHVRQALKDINTTSEWLTAAEKGLLFGPTKTHAARKLSLPSPIAAMLAEHLAGPIPGGAGADALIFTAPEGGPVRHGLFYKRVFKAALVGDERNKDPKKRRKAALPKALHALRWHDLRHTCAALSLEVQPNLAMVQARLGHEDIRTTINVYGHLLPSVEAALADGLTATFNDAQGSDNVTALRTSNRSSPKRGHIN